MKYVFLKSPVQLPKPISLKEKRQYILHAIGVEWYRRKTNEKLPPLKKLKLIKEHNKIG